MPPNTVGRVAPAAVSATTPILPDCFFVDTANSYPNPPSNSNDLQLRKAPLPFHQPFLAQRNSGKPLTCGFACSVPLPPSGAPRPLSPAVPHRSGVPAGRA